MTGLRLGDCEVGLGATYLLEPFVTRNNRKATERCCLNMGNRRGARGSSRIKSEGCFFQFSLSAYLFVICDLLLDIPWLSGAHKLDPILGLGVNLFPSRFILRTHAKGPLTQ